MSRSDVVASKNQTLQTYVFHITRVQQLDNVQYSFELFLTLHGWYVLGSNLSLLNRLINNRGFFRVH